MFTRYQTKQLAFLNTVNDDSTLFLAPAYVDFSRVNNIEFIGLIKASTTNFNVTKTKDIICSSTNAIIALLLGLGYTVNELKGELRKVNFYQSAINTCQRPLVVLVDSNKRCSKNGLEKQKFRCLEEDKFLIWAKQQIANKLIDPYATFLDLHQQVQINNTFKNIHFMGFNLTTNKLVLLNYINTPDMPIAIAARICMSFSTTFSIVEINYLMANKQYVYTDGGIALQHIKF